MRRTRNLKTGLSVVLGVSLVAGMASHVPEAEAKAYSRPAPPVQADRSVPGKDVTSAGRRFDDPTAAAAKVSTPRPVWPAAGSVRVPLVPTAAGSAAVVAPALRRVGNSVLSVGPVPGSVSGSLAPAAVRFDILERARSEQLGVHGLVVRAARADGRAEPGRVRLQIDYSTFRSAFGGDWASRLRLITLDCSSATSCRAGRVLAGSNDLRTGTYTANVDLSPSAAAAPTSDTFALAAAAAGPNGSYGATTLAPSSTWNVSLQTGDFTWSYPLRVPPATGPRPELGIGYSSGSVDGQTASTNNQPSMLGQGHVLEPGFVERKYVACADDMSGGANNSTKTGDLCWKSDNATLSLGSHSSELLWDAAQNAWKLRKDDGSRIERLTGAANGARDGEHWRLTTTDGTQYYFGLNPLAYDTLRSNSVSKVPVFGNHSGEPCHGATFATSYCDQAWRWNVDRVVDPSGNVMTYRYVQETNNYGRNNNTGVSSYERASYLSVIEYGERLGADLGVPPTRVVLGTTERCLPSGSITCAPAQLTAANASYWPDVPFDQICSSSTTCPSVTSPAFFTRRRYYTLYTQYWTGAAMQDVDSWSFAQTFPDPGDGTSKALWLSSITHKGLVGGTVTDPAVTFTGVQMSNRVDNFTGGAAPMNKWRIRAIATESGGQISVSYSGQQCSSTVKPADVANNGMRCFPVYWTREGGEAPTLHWFHKYIVTGTVEDDLTTDAPDKQTSYVYTGSPAWHYDDNELTLPKYRTWGDWRGYNYVSVQTGPAGWQTSERYLFFRGMHGDRANTAGTSTKSVTITDTRGAEHTDLERLNGYVREHIVYNGNGGAEVTGTINSPWLRQTGSGDGHTAELLGTGVSRIRTRLADGTYRTAGVDSDFDALGMPVAVSDLGDVTRGDDDRCTRYTYNRNTTTGITSTVSREETVSVSCDATPSRPADVTKDERTYYDGHTGLTTPPSDGLVSAAETMSGWSGGPVYEQRARMDHDVMGRVTKTYDGLDRLSSTVEYVPSSGGPVTQTATTNAAGHESRTTLAPAWGSSAVEIDPNGKRTDLAYDPSGRLTGVWLPDRSKAGGATASAVFSYVLSKTQPNVVTTQELRHNSTYKVSRTLFDGFLRKRQVQTPGANGSGRLIYDTRYNSRGVVVDEGGPYFESSTAPTTTLYDVLEQNLPAQTVYNVDGMNRVVAEIFKVQGAERWRTTTSYEGDRTSVDPPDGATATTTVDDVRGNTVELRQYLGGSPTGSYDSTTYAYSPRDELEAVTNPVGSVWRYAYDLRGRQIQTIDPDKGTTTSTFDDADRLASTTDARGESLYYSYDSLDRKTAVRQGSATGTVLASWAYDSLAKGLLTSSTRFADGNAYVSAITGYDAVDRPTGTRITVPASEGKLAGTYTSSSTYNPDGSVDSVTMPQVPGLPNETVDMTYDNGDNLQAIGGWSAYVVGALYSSYGDPLRYTQGDVVGGKSTWRSFTYEEGTRRLATMKVDRQQFQTTDDTFNYSYDAAGNVQAIAQVYGQGTLLDRECFDYDYLRRLTQAWTTSNASCSTAPSTSTLGSTVPYWRTYSYWKSGNRGSVVDHAAAGNTTRTYAYPAGDAARPHGVTSVNSAGPSGTAVDSYAYDASGNLKTRTEVGDTDTFAWDSEGHLTSVTGAGGTTGYVYDAEGQRLIRHDPTGATLYLGQTEIRWNSSTDTVSSTRYYEFNGSTVSVRTSSTAVEDLIADQHGTATVSVDKYSATLSRRWMDPFGMPRAQYSTWEQNTHGFVDGVQDTSTGLTHLGAREYDPHLGKFISVDPLVDPSDPQSLNAYAYAANNPVSMSDPDGLAVVIDLPSGGKVASTASNAKDIVRHARETYERNSRKTAEQRVQDEIDHNISYHTEQKAKAKERVKRIVKDLVKIVADELGITDALNCFTNGDIGSCVSTGITVLATFAGGIAGKLLTKYGTPWKWKRAARLIGHVKDLVGEAIDGIKGWRKADQELRRLTARSDEFNAMLDDIAQRKRTASVLSTHDGPDVVGGGARDLSPAQREAVGDGEVIARSPGDHAESTVLKEAANRGLSPKAIAASRPFCNACRAMLESDGATIVSRRTALWRGQ